MAYTPISVLVNYGSIMSMFKKFSMVGFLFCSTAYCSKVLDNLPAVPYVVNNVFRETFTAGFAIPDIIENARVAEEKLSSVDPLDVVAKSGKSKQNKPDYTCNKSGTIVIKKKKINWQERTAVNLADKSVLLRALVTNAASDSVKPLEYKNNFDTKVARFKVINNLFEISKLLSNSSKEEEIRKSTLKKVLDDNFNKDFPEISIRHFDLKLMYYLFYSSTVSLNGEKIKQNWAPYTVSTILKYFKTLEEKGIENEFTEKIRNVVFRDKGLSAILGFVDSSQ